MRNFASVAPGAVWIALILGLTGGATLLMDYFGASVPAWVPALILTVIVPMLKILATPEPPPTRTMDAPPPAARSLFKRWLF
jgi:hypothetical protein